MGVIEEIKSALRTAADVGSQIDKVNTRSIARGANEQSFLFPVIMESSIGVDRAVTLMRNLDRLYASWTQIYLSGIGVIDLNYIKNPKQFIAKYQPKFRLESGDDFDEPAYDAELVPLYGEDEMLFHESTEDTEKLLLISRALNTNGGAYKKMRAGMEPFLEGYNLRGLPKRQHPTVYTEASRDAAPTAKENLTDAILDNTVQNAQNKARGEQLRNTKDARAPKMTDNDVKKINDMQPYALELRLLASKGDSAFSEWINYTIGVKSVLHLADSNILLRNLIYILKNKNPVFNFIRWKTGEISLMKDIILHLDDINFDIANKRNKTGKYLSSLKDLKKRYLKVGTFGVNRIAPFATIAISSETYQDIKDNYGYDLKNMTFASKIMSELFLMCFVILDDVTHTVDILVDGAYDFQTYSLETLDREVTMGSNKIGKELTRMLGNG